MNWVYGARYTTANTLMPQLTYEKKFKVLKGLHVSLNGNYNFGQSYAADTAVANYNWLGERVNPRALRESWPIPNTVIATTTAQPTSVWPFSPRTAIPYL